MKTRHLVFVIGAFGVASAVLCRAISIGGFDPVRTFTNVVTASPRAMVGTVQTILNDGRDPGRILQPYKDVANSVAPLPQLATNAATWPQQQLYQEASNLAKNVGPAGSFVFDVAAVADNYCVSAIRAEGAIATNVLLGKNPLEIVGMPLAAANPQPTGEAFADTPTTR